MKNPGVNYREDAFRRKAYHFNPDAGSCFGKIPVRVGRVAGRMEKEDRRILEIGGIKGSASSSGSMSTRRC
jgi:hypothetical protein